MQYIEKVEISKFRSLGENNIIVCGKINIFSGSNDSGKSNVIKALNLFFNDRTDIFTNFNPENDFNKWFKDRNARGQRNVTIKVYIKRGAYKDPAGINKGFVAEKIFGIDGSIQTNFYVMNAENKEEKLPHDSASHKRADSVIRNQISFIYIPAIRDLDFRRYIQRQLLEITNSGNGQLGDIFKKLKAELNSTFTDFGKDLHKFIDINVLSDVNFATLLESMSFSTDEQITIKKIGRGGNIDEKQNIPIANRGDGIQMQFLSFLLWFIANKDDKHKYIWGFEEPEIAYEFQKQFEMADIFINTFSNNAQIFLTTHSPAFISVDPHDKSRGIYQYRIHKIVDTTKNNRTISVVTDIDKYIGEANLFEQPDNHSRYLFQDLWGVNYQRLANSLGYILKKSKDYIELEDNYRIVSELIAKSKSEIMTQQAELDKLKAAQRDLYPENIFICEDKDAPNIWRHLFEEFGIDAEIAVISSKGCCNNHVEIIFSNKVDEVVGYNPRIYRQLDRDGYLPEQIDFIEKSVRDKFPKIKHYKVAFLPVNELENFVIISSGLFSNELIRRCEQKYDDAKDACFNTAKNNLESCRKTYISSKNNDQRKELIKRLFVDKECVMRNEAKKDPMKLLPGKDLYKVVNRFNPSAHLHQLKRENFPDELNQYLQQIKDFFA